MLDEQTDRWNLLSGQTDQHTVVVIDWFWIPKTNMWNGENFSRSRKQFFIMLQMDVTLIVTPSLAGLCSSGKVSLSTILPYLSLI